MIWLLIWAIVAGLGFCGEVLNLFLANALTGRAAARTVTVALLWPLAFLVLSLFMAVGFLTWLRD